MMDAVASSTLACSQKDSSGKISQLSCLSAYIAKIYHKSGPPTDPAPKSTLISIGVSYGFTTVLKKKLGE